MNGDHLEDAYISRTDRIIDMGVAAAEVRARAAAPGTRNSIGASQTGFVPQATLIQTNSFIVRTKQV